MKKTWTLIALAAALCVSCSDDDKSCTEGAAFCKSGDNNTTVLVTCENGELNETVCNTGYICDSKKKMCTVAAECSNDMKPSCDQANNRIVYCSNNVITYTDCANGCSVETNKCNPATAGKGECTAGAKRCNLAGEREICSAAGVWESKPCCAKGDSACILTCNSGECSSTLKEGTTRCASSSTYQVFESGAWSAAKNCSADKPVCVPSKATCIGKSDTYSYCGKEQYSEKQTSDQYCSATDGNDFLGYCFEAQGKTYLECGQSCTIDKIGDKKNGLCVQDGNSYFSIDIVCTVVDADHFAYLSDYSTVKECKNGCNADKTGCGDSGSSGGDSSGGGSSSADPYIWCNDAQLKSGGTVGDYCKKNVGKNYVGLCNGSSASCFESCTEAQAGQKKAICETSDGESTSFDLVCKSYGGNYAFGLVGTYTECKGSCDAKKESCDAQGGTAGGSEFGSGSGGGSTDKPWYCGKEQYSEQQTIDQYCSANEGSDFLGYCTIEDGETYFECGQSCTIDKVGNKNGLCVKEGSNYFSFDSVCTVVDADHTAYLADYSNVKKCTDGCNTEGTDCK